MVTLENKRLLLIAEAIEYNSQVFRKSNLYGESPLLLESNLSEVGNPFESGISRVVGSTTIFPSRNGTGIFFAGITQDPKPAMTTHYSNSKHLIFGNHERQLVRSYGLEINEAELTSYFGMTMNSLKGSFSDQKINHLKVDWIGLKSTKNTNLIDEPYPMEPCAQPKPNDFEYSIGLKIGEGTIPLKEIDFSISQDLNVWNLQDTLGPQPFPTRSKKARTAVTITGNLKYEHLKKDQDLLKYKTFDYVTLMLTPKIDGEPKKGWGFQTWLVLPQAKVDFNPTGTKLDSTVPFKITAEKSESKPSTPLYYIDVSYDDFLPLESYNTKSFSFNAREQWREHP